MKFNSHDILNKFGCKVTNARVAILESFPANCKPLNAEHIHGLLKKNRIDLATVYRTLTLFEKKGIIRRIDLRKDSIYYELTLSHHHHHHIVCTQCGKTESFEKCEVGKLSKHIIRTSRAFSIINQHSLELFGVCKVCAKG